MLFHALSAIRATVRTSSDASEANLDVEMKRGLFTVIAALNLGACNFDPDVRANKPPPNLPKGAVPMGGHDGLHWTVCEKLSKTDFVCDIYRGADGLKMRRGWYRLCLSKSAFQTDVGGADGTDGLFQINVVAVSYKKPQFYNGFVEIDVPEKWNPENTGLDQDCLDIKPKAK